MILPAKILAQIPAAIPAHTHSASNHVKVRVEGLHVKPLVGSPVRVLVTILPATIPAPILVTIHVHTRNVRHHVKVRVEGLHVKPLVGIHARILVKVPVNIRVRVPAHLPLASAYAVGIVTIQNLQYTPDRYAKPHAETLSVYLPASTHT
jgi:hypothetical protein